MCCFPYKCAQKRQPQEQQLTQQKGETLRGAAPPAENRLLNKGVGA